MPNQELIPFKIDTGEVRSFLAADNVAWFAARDVASALGITWSGATLVSIPDRWKGMLKLNNPSGGGKQDTAIISEPAVYKLAFRSNKPEAERFTDRVAEIVVELRKTGRYELPSAATALPGASPSLKALTEMVRDARSLVMSMYPRLDEEERFHTINHIVKQQTGIDIHALAGSPPIGKLQRPRSTEEGKIFLAALKKLISTGQATLLPIYKKVEADPKAIGWLEADDTLFLHPKIAHTVVLNFLGENGLNHISRPVLYRQLNALGVIGIRGAGRHTRPVRVGGRIVKVLHLITLEVPTTGEEVENA